MATGAPTSEASRSGCQGAQAEGDHAGPRLGRADPGPPGFAERDDKRIYVWFDAVIGYLSARRVGRNRGTPEAWREWWQNLDARHVYFMGKDNIVFHRVIWPSILLGYGAGGEVGAGRGPLERPYDIVAASS